MWLAWYVCLKWSLRWCSLAWYLVEMGVISQESDGGGIPHTAAIEPQCGHSFNRDTGLSWYGLHRPFEAFSGSTVVTVL